MKAYIVPGVKLVTVGFGIELFENTGPVGETDQRPVDGEVTLVPLNAMLEDVLHTFWSGPALAAGCVELKTFITTSSVKTSGLAHGPLYMVQR